MIVKVWCGAYYSRAKKRFWGVKWTNPLASCYVIPYNQLKGYYPSEEEAQEAIEAFKAKCSAKDNNEQKTVFEEEITNVSETYTFIQAANSLTGELFKQYLVENNLQNVSINV